MDRMDRKEDAAQKRYIFAKVVYSVVVQVQRSAEQLIERAGVEHVEEQVD